jgi:hypothetical protein
MVSKPKATATREVVQSQNPRGGFDAIKGYSFFPATRRRELHITSDVSCQTQISVRESADPRAIVTIARRAAGVLMRINDPDAVQKPMQVGARWPSARMLPAS